MGKITIITQEGEEWLRAHAFNLIHQYEQSVLNNNGEGVSNLVQWDIKTDDGNIYGIIVYHTKHGVIAKCSKSIKIEPDENKETTQIEGR
jgi:sporulation protein YlmC with PRC-barrel domain